MKKLAVIALACACHSAPAKPEAAIEHQRTAQLARGAVTDRVILTGELRAASAVELVVPRTSTWTLAIRWMAEDGALVKAGDRVLSFDNSAATTDLESKRLALLEAQMTLQTARDLSVMETQTKENELAQHQVALDKAKVLAAVPGDLLAKRDFQERQLEQKRAEIAVKKAKEDLEAQTQEADLDLRVKQIDLEKAQRAIDDADTMIDQLEIKAPRDGIVVIGMHPWEEPQRKYRLGDPVQPGWAIITMPDPSAGMVVHSVLSDVDDGRVNVGMTGTCTLDAYPAEPMACTVTQLTPVARSTNEQSLRRAFAVELSLANSDQRLRSGMSVKVELARPGVKDALVVPRAAVVFSADGKQARVRLAGGDLRDVGLGPCDAQSCVVERGANAGDTVVIGGGS